MWKVLVLVITFWAGFQLNWSQFLQCHDDPAPTPSEGPLEYVQFTWLGMLQYIHIKKGTPHYFRVPRVALITRRYVLSAAKDASEIPEGYALGNVAFGEYERDEVECQVTEEMMAAGEECEPGAVLIPIADAVLHPEYQHFEAAHSIAVLKLLTPIASRYMVPVCLPLHDYLATDSKIKSIYLVDYTNTVPRDIMNEEKEITKLNLLPKELCYLYDGEENVTIPDTSKMICTSGCGLNFGAPSVLHEHTGHWTLVSLSLGGGPCPDPLRTSRPPPPPSHILISPYVPWIMSAVGRVPYSGKDDPFGYMPRSKALSPEDELFGVDWNGRWWLGGLPCYWRGEAAQNMFKFYHEVFQVEPFMKSDLTYYLEIIAAYRSVVVCVKVGLPYQQKKPKAWGLDTSRTKIRIPVLSFKRMYRFQVEAFAMKTLEEEPSNETSSSEEAVLD